MALKRRTQNPPSYSKYSSYKKHLRIEFDHRCAYCNIHEAEDGGSKKFHIDHYLPKSIFPGKCCEYSNLFYSCADCNILKGNYWASWIQKLFHTYILNPCDYDYDIHFDCTKSEWIPKTSVAKWNIEKLRLNSKKKIDIRKTRDFFLKIIEELMEKKKRFEIALTDNKLCQSDFKEIKNQIDELNRQINLYKFKILTPLE